MARANDLPETGPLQEAQREVLAAEAALKAARDRRDLLIQGWLARHEGQRWERALGRVLGLSQGALRAAANRRIDPPE